MATMGGVQLLLFSVLIFLYPHMDIEGRQSKSRFTNFQCISYNESYCRFEKCKLSLLGRGRVGASFYLKMFVLPAENVWINWSISRRYNGWRPFLYNISTDFCHLIKNSNKLSFEGLVINAIMTKSNLNHTCPYNHDIIMDNLEYSDDFLRNLPLPQGDYKIELRFATDKVWRVQVTVFILKAE